MTCFKYQVYLYGLEAITYLSAILWVVTDPALWVIRLPPTPHYRQPSPLVYGSITFIHLKENFSMVKLPYLCKKSKGKLVWLGDHRVKKDKQSSTACPFENRRQTDCRTVVYIFYLQIFYRQRKVGCLILRIMILRKIHKGSKLID